MLYIEQTLQKPNIFKDIQCEIIHSPRIAYLFKKKGGKRIRGKEGGGKQNLEFVQIWRPVL